MNQQKRRIILVLAFLLSFIPMGFMQFGGANASVFVPGLLHLYHPLTILAILLYFVALFVPLKKKNLNHRLGMIALLMILFVELYNYFTWFDPNFLYLKQGKFSMAFSRALPMFYVGFAVSVAMLLFYVLFTKKYPLFPKIEKKQSEMEEVHLKKRVKAVSKKKKQS